MAIAGSTQEAFFLRLEDGELRAIGKHRLSSHMIEDDVEKALATLRNGKAVYLLDYGDNLPRLRRMAQGVVLCGAFLFFWLFWQPAQIKAVVEPAESCTSSVRGDEPPVVMCKVLWLPVIAR